MSSKQHDSRKFERPETFHQYYVNHLVNATDAVFTRQGITLQARSNTWMKLTGAIESATDPSTPIGWAADIIDSHANNFCATRAKAFFYRYCHVAVCDYGEHFEENFEFLANQIYAVTKAIDDRAMNFTIDPKIKLTNGPAINPNTNDRYFTTIENPQTLREFFINDLIRNNAVNGYGIDFEINSDLNIDKFFDGYGYLCLELGRQQQYDLNAGLWGIGEDEKECGELSLISKNEAEFNALYNKHAPDKGLKHLIPLLDNLIDQHEGFDKIKAHGLTDLHKAKARTSLKRAVYAYYNHQTFTQPTSHKVHFLGINPATGMEYFSTYASPQTFHEHFINNIFLEERVLYFKSPVEHSKKHSKISDIDEHTNQSINTSLTCIYLCTLAENEKEKQRHALLRGHLGKINSILESNPTEQAQQKATEILTEAFSSYSSIHDSPVETEVISIVTRAMHKAIEKVTETKQRQASPNQSRRLQLILNRN